MQLGNFLSSFLAQPENSNTGENFSIPAAELRTALNVVVRDSLPSVAGGLSALYFILAVSHALLWARAIAIPMSLVALATGFSLLFMRSRLQSRMIEERWAHPLGAVIAGLVLVNCLLHLYFIPEPQQTTNLVLLIIGAGLLFLSSGWLTLVVLTTLIGWTGMVWLAPNSPGWLHFGFALYMATVLAVIVHAVRVRTFTRLETLRLQDERRKADLEKALDATETARRAAETMKQDLMQSEARLRLVTNQMPAVLWTTDSELRITSSLGMGLSTLDLQPQEVLEMMRFKYSPPAAPEFLPIAAHRRALEGESVSYEINWKGHTFGCQVEPLHGADKKLIGTLGIAFDITARKLAEESLSKSEEQFRLTFELAPIGMALTSLEGKILRVNQAFCTTLGYSAEELLSRTFADITHPDDRAGYLAHRAQLLHGEIAHFQIERRFVSKDGKIIFTLLQVGLVQDPQGAPLYFIGQALDITDLKLAEEEIHQLNTKLEQRVQTRTAELRESEERFRQLAEQVQDVFWIYSPQQERLLYVSPAFELIWRQPCERLYEWPGYWWEAIHPDDQAATQKTFSGRREQYEIEYRLLLPDGETRWILESGFPIRDQAGAVYRMAGTARDITARKQAAEALRKSEERYRALYDDNPSMYFTVDAAGKILSVNTFGAEQLGYGVDELVGQSALTLFCAEDRAEAQQQMDFCLQNPQKLHRWELRKVHRNGSLMWGRETVRATWNAAGQLVVFIVCEDITSRKRLEEEIRQYTEKLEQLVTARALRIQTLERQRAESEKLAATGRMAARIAHEINNPLAGIKNSFLLLKGAIPADHPDYHYAQRIENEIERIARIVRQMFELHRPEQDSVRAFSVQTAIHDVAAMLKAHTHERNLTVEIEINPLALVATLSESALRQVLYNVIQNAIDASPAGGVIKIAAWQQQRHLLITVADQGRGIPEDIRQKIFEPFFTTKSRMGLKTGGLGLGLSVTKSLIKTMQGAIDFASEEEQGTIFRIQLPLDGSALENFSTAETSAAAPTAGPEPWENNDDGADATDFEVEPARILCVDDDPAFLHATAELLRVEGCLCDQATDVAAAINLLRAQPYELLIADVKMPGNDELELIKALPKISADLAVILVTDYPSLETAIESIRLPVTAYLTKPVDFDELLVLVRKGIHDVRALRKVQAHHDAG